MHLKNNLETFFHYFLWTTLLTLSLYILFFICSIFFQTMLEDQTECYVKEMIQSISNHIYSSNSNTCSYCTNIDQEKQPYRALLASMNNNLFPIKNYIDVSKELENQSTTIANASTNTLEDTTPLEPSTPENQLSNETFFEDNDEYDSDSAFATHVLSNSEQEALIQNRNLITTLKSNKSRNYLLENFYKVNDSTGIDKTIFDVPSLLSTHVAIEKDNSSPQILIFHTHAHEAFADSRSGVRDDTVVGVGDELATILTEEYGYNVVHYVKQYNFNSAYNQALSDLESLVKQYPNLQVILDIHRDSKGSKKNVISINNKNTAQIMFFNGVSYNRSGPITYLKNNNLQMNLAFSLQMKLYAMEQYPQLTKKNFIKSYRYNMHMKGRYALIEVGDNANTVQEAKNAMTPLADIINHVLTTTE